MVDTNKTVEDSTASDVLNDPQSDALDPALCDSEKLDPVLECKVLWRLDILLVPILCILYLLAFLDRSNIGNARIAGLQTDLSMSNTQYSTGK
jgi:hypothetical protein